jgi:hypothetical protein
MPALKENSKTPEIVDAFVALALFGSKTRPLWRLQKEHFSRITAEVLIQFAGKINKKINSHLYTRLSHPFIDPVVAMMAKQTRRSILTFHVPPLSAERNGFPATPSKGNRLMITSYGVMILKRR